MKPMKPGLAVLTGWAIAVAATAAGSLDGLWGGDRLRLVVDADGATLESDCADGRIAGPIVLTGDGSFVATGRFVRHKGGPEVVVAVPASDAARFAGQVKGDMLMLSILPAGASAPQTFNLRKGAAIKLVRCL